MDSEKFEKLFTTEPVPLQEPHELAWLVNKVEKLKPLRIIVEVGIDKGGTLKFWDEIIEQKGLIIGIDINQALLFKPLHNHKYIFRDSTIPKTFEELIIYLDTNPIDFLHLDGCHEGAVFKDYAHFAPLVRKGGLIAMHDCGEPTSFYHKDATSTRWTRGGAPDVVKCFSEVKLEKEVLQYDQGTGVIYV